MDNSDILRSETRPPGAQAQINRFPTLLTQDAKNRPRTTSIPVGSPVVDLNEPEGPRDRIG